MGFDESLHPEKQPCTFEMIKGKNEGKNILIFNSSEPILKKNKGRVSNEATLGDFTGTLKLSG